MENIISCNNVGIKFSKTTPTPTLAGWLNYKFSDNDSYFWALRNISFTVQKGELVGMIGKNGAGKSTLLRVVAEIISPDEGQISVKTKTNLLARGVGVRDHLSGRENIILGSLYLGKSLDEINKNMNSMVEFSELEEHIDRPVRYYSSGMVSKLLFTIATSINPEFLLLDELLSGGDLGFREKAKNRMLEVVNRSKGGLVATHNLQFVKESCSKVIYLDKGEMRFFGNAEEGVEMYLEEIGMSRKKSENNEIALEED
ncbi:MAG: ABC transporter ATP-binding protein [Nitrosarchaeum sp.]|nr:ABC transporter ATP-binding protein [Nitrosarchaeum sp.]